MSKKTQPTDKVDISDEALIELIKTDIPIPKEKPLPTPPTPPEPPYPVRMIKQNEKLKLKEKIKLMLKPTQTFLVTMFFANGTTTHFVIEAKEHFFKYKKKKYHINPDVAWYDINFHQSRLFYYIDYLEPLDKTIYCDGNKSYLKITPDSIEPLIEMEYIKVLSQSQQLTKWIKMAIFLLIIVLGLSFVNTIVFLLQSGIMEGVLPV